MFTDILLYYMYYGKMLLTPTKDVNIIYKYIWINIHVSQKWWSTIQQIKKEEKLLFTIEYKKIPGHCLIFNLHVHQKSNQSTCKLSVTYLT